MLLSPIFLCRMADGYPVGDAWPYRGGSRQDILQHLEHAAEGLRQSPTLRVESDFTLLHDDAARSAHVYCCKKHEWPARHAGPACSVEGIVVFLCSLAPVAFYCPLEVLRSNQGDGYRYNLQQAGSLPPGDWNGELQWIVKNLEASGFRVPSREALVEPLPSVAEIPAHLWGVSEANLFF
jgi:hypothetical protein